MNVAPWQDTIRQLSNVWHSFLRIVLVLLKWFLTKFYWVKFHRTSFRKSLGVKPLVKEVSGLLLSVLGLLDFEDHVETNEKKGQRSLNNELADVWKQHNPGVELHIRFVCLSNSCFCIVRFYHQLNPLISQSWLASTTWSWSVSLYSEQLSWREISHCEIKVGSNLPWNGLEITGLPDDMQFWQFSGENLVTVKTPLLHVELWSKIEICSEFLELWNSGCTWVTSLKSLIFNQIILTSYFCDDQDMISKPSTQTWSSTFFSVQNYD